MLPGSSLAALEALAALRGAGSARLEIRELPVSALRVGMRFTDDVRLSGGARLGPARFTGMRWRATNRR